ncbi:type II secretion system protein [Lacticaseibacillus nasuensis]|uniref:type II secretion system protein n=1 Tax=Lacticaseibacillus nasuensis TaxID=944671 RepID=UPI002245980A|nr:type II secretion system protein [Lacticaseibacillus nasuensis]MCX2455389.1 type II secretion system GspH family protein [Lacticaseibacillus nasuensis]
MKKRLRGFTLVEVLAALGIIIVLTLSLVATIQAQVTRAHRQHLEALVAVVNSEIVAAYQGQNVATSDLKSGETMVKAQIITSAQWQELAGAVKLSLEEPPQFTLTGEP